MRLAIGLGIAAILATLVSFAVEGRSWIGSLGVALLIVGSFKLLMAFAGDSPGMRLGTQPAYLAGLFPRLARQTGTRIRGHVSATRRSSFSRGRACSWPA